MTDDRQLSHPAACPYCGGTKVNIVVIDELLAAAVLRDDGTILMGDTDDHGQWRGPDMLFCHGCSSTYVIPEGVRVDLDDSLVEESPARSPLAHEPGYIGAEVQWVPMAVVKVTAFVPAEAVAALAAMERRLRGLCSAPGCRTRAASDGLCTVHDQERAR